MLLDEAVENLAVGRQTAQCRLFLLPLIDCRASLALIECRRGGKPEWTGRRLELPQLTIVT
jgi:hypothetical protein